jgi:sodium transport system permease protein
MMLLLIPLSAFFSALCLALAVLARSMKEGQYYMTPLYLICLPLILLSLAPGVELNLFYSLVPITGVALLLRALILGDFFVAWQYFLPVLVPTIIYGSLALRWAIDQFEREDVLFREAERFDLRSWLRHIVRDKEAIPTGGEALLCFVLMLCAAWFLMQLISPGALGPAEPGAGGGHRQTDSLMSIAIGQAAFVLLPPVLMAVLLTSSPRRTLRLYWPRMRELAIAIGLAFTLNPLINELSPIIERNFPISENIKAILAQLFSPTSLGAALLVFALIPAVCEEFAFRGFILSGLQSGRSNRSAIVLSALLFGFLHVLLSVIGQQQFLNSTLLGLVLGLIAVRSGSIVPGIAFHFLNNGLAVFRQSLGDLSAWRVGRWIFRDPAEGLYHKWLIAICALASIALLFILNRTGEPDGVRDAHDSLDLVEPAS